MSLEELRREVAADAELEVATEDDVVDAGESPEDDEELEEITLDGAESPTAKAEEETPVIKQVREAHRESERKRKEAERKLAELESKYQPPAEEAPVVLKKPTVDEFDFDTDKFAEALDKYHESRKAHEAWEAKQAESKQAEVAAQQKVIEGYRAKVAELKVDKTKYANAEREVVSSFDTAQQTILLMSKMPERLVYAIGNNPEKLEELAKIKDPITLAYELGRTESKLLSLKKPKDAPSPERVITSGSGANESIRQQLDKLAEAGDVAAYRKLKLQHAAKVK